MYQHWLHLKISYKNLFVLLMIVYVISSRYLRKVIIFYGCILSVFGRTVIGPRRNRGYASCERTVMSANSLNCYNV